MSIRDFTQIARQQPPTQNAVLGLGPRDRIDLRAPLNPPSNWTKFKAAMSHVPLLGRIGGLQEARRTVAEFPLKLQNYQASNRQILAGFTLDLQERFGTHIANMAMQGATPGDGQPLSQRTVSQVLDGALRFENANKAQNNMEVTRFLDSPLAGGMRLRGETDMNGVFLEMGFDLNGKGGWQEVLGTGATDFVTRFVETSIAGMPEHGRSRISNGDIADLASQALGFYREIAAAPNMTSEKLDGVLRRAADKDSAAGILSAAREFAIVDRLETHLNRRDSESLLRQTAGLLALKHDMPQISDAVMKSIAGSIIEQLSFSADSLPETLDCETDVSSIIDALDDELKSKLTQAITQHYEALGMIATSESLTETQRTHLSEIAQTRRIDPVQVRAYESVGGTLAGTLARTDEYLGGGSVDLLLTSLRDSLTTIGHNKDQMVENGASLWESGSLLSGEMDNTLMMEFAGMACGTLSREQARGLLDKLTGDGMKTLLQAMMLADDVAMAGAMPMLLSTLIEAVALRAGQTPEVAMQTAMAVGQGPEIALNDLPPRLAMMVQSVNPGEIDERGVKAGAPHGDRIAGGFRFSALIEEKTSDVLSFMLEEKLEEDSWMPSALTRDFGRALMHVNGKTISGPRIDPLDSREMLGELLGELDDPMKTAIAHTLHQGAGNFVVSLVNFNALGEDQMLVHAGGGTEVEVSAQKDGSWLSRVTIKQYPRAMTGTGDETIELDATGLMMVSVTYRTTPGEMGGKPVTTIEDSSVVFDF